MQLLVDKYRTARHTLKFLGRELEGTIGAMEAALEAKGAVEGRLERVSGDAKVKVQRLQEASKKERQALVHTALRSLDLLRSHLASHNAGTLQPPPPSLAISSFSAAAALGSTAGQLWPSSSSAESGDYAFSRPDSFLQERTLAWGTSEPELEPALTRPRSLTSLSSSHVAACSVSERGVQHRAQYVASR